MAVPELAAGTPVPQACAHGAKRVPDRLGHGRLPLPAPSGARGCRSVRRAVLRLLRGDGLADPGEETWLANAVPPDRRGHARRSKQLARSARPIVADAAREPASLHAQALRTDRRRAPAGGDARDRRRAVRSPWAVGAR